jgi:hypothetical protein
MNGELEEVKEIKEVTELEEIKEQSGLLVNITLPDRLFL